MAANEITTTKMENNNVTTTNVEVPVQVMMKDLKKVAAGKRLTESNCRKKGELAQVAKAQESEPRLTLNQADSAGAVIAVGVLGILGYYIYQSRTGDNNASKVNPV